MTTTHTKALEYVLTQGYSVIPVGDDKRPLINWKPYQERHATEEEIEAWYTRWPEAGIGIVTGKISNLTVVDIDVKEQPTTERSVFPETYTVQTRSGGYHLYYDYSDAVQTCADQYFDYPHVDIRNDGGYVVAPPTDGYTVLDAQALSAFPVSHFADKKGRKRARNKKKFEIADAVGIKEGGRNQAMTQLIGGLLSGAPRASWQTKIWPAVVSINQTYTPPLSEDELKTTFESVAGLELQKREQKDKEVEMIKSPIEVSDVEAVRMRLRGNKSGPFKDTVNAKLALGMHSDWAQAFKYDEFTKRIMYRGEPMRDVDIMDAVVWLQGPVDLPGIPKSVVRDAVESRAYDCKFNSAQDWLKTLEWDGVPRVDEWLHKVYGVDNDEYHQKVGSNWLRAVVKRIMRPGCKFDHVLVIQGGQGVKKTTSFAALGGPLHVETSIHAGSKDFLMQFEGKAIVEFSEGETLNRTETRELKAIITRTHDKYRAPYARSDEEYPRMCVFCMTTNDTEFLKDETGNRRWWVVRMPSGKEANVEWLEENRDQLFAECMQRLDENTWEVPQEEAERRQEDSRMIDTIEEDIVEWYLKLDVDTQEGGVRVKDYFTHMYKEDEPERRPKSIPWGVEQKIKNVFKGALKLEYTQRRRVDGRVRRWFPTEKTDKITKCHT